MKMFEQLRKNFKLNLAWKGVDPAEKNQVLRDLRKDFYDGLIGDLMESKMYQLAEIVMSEKIKEKFEVTTNDELISLNIYSSQRKFEEYREKFELFLDELDFNQEISVVLGKTLMIFDTEEFKNSRLMLSERLSKMMSKSMTEYDGELLHSLMYVYTEAQQWEKVTETLKQLTSNENCKPDQKTVRYLKNNLIYCFQNSMRLEL